MQLQPIIGHKNPFLAYYQDNNPHTMNINFHRRHSLDNRYPRNNGPFLLHLVEEHQDRRLALRESADEDDVAAAATSTTSSTNATATARVQPVTATTGHIMNNTMVVSLHHLVEGEYARRGLRVVPRSLSPTAAPPRRRTTPRRRTASWRWRGGGRGQQPCRRHSIDAGGGVVVTTTTRRTGRKGQEEDNNTAANTSTNTATNTDITRSDATTNTQQ